MPGSDPSLRMRIVEGAWSYLGIRVFETNGDINSYLMIPKAPPSSLPLLCLVYMYMEKIKTKIKSMSPSGEVRRHFFCTHASKIGLAFPSRRPRDTADHSPLCTNGRGRDWDLSHRPKKKSFVMSRSEMNDIR